jgi:hypothetical protein
LKKDKFSNDEISDLLTPKFDNTSSETSSQGEIDSRRLVVITSYDSATFQVESIIWDKNP